MTSADSVAAARSNVAAEMFSAIIRTVLFEHTAASAERVAIPKRQSAKYAAPIAAGVTRAVSMH